MSGWGTIYRNATSALRQHSQTLARLQEQVSSGRRVIRGSDEPSTANYILNLRSQSRALDSYEENLATVTLSLEQVESALRSVSQALTDVGAALTDANKGTLNQENRNSLADKVDGLLKQILMQANHNSLGRHIFSGQKLATRPYAIKQTGETITSVTYQGGQHDLAVPVAPGVLYSGLMVGDDVFRRNGRGWPQFLGPTGAAAGAGTSSVTGDVYLTVENANSTFQGAAHGLTNGDDAADDTIVSTHTLTVNAAGQTVSLDGGGPVSFQLTDTNLEVANGAGDLMYVDMTAWDGLDASITVVGEARLYIDDPAVATTVADFSVDATVLDSDGRVLRVNPSGIVRPGLETIRMRGTYDVFGTLINIRDVMRNTHNLSEEKQLMLLIAADGSLKEVSAGVRQSLTASGARLQAMDSLQLSLDDIKFATDSNANALQDADIVQVAAELAQTQTLYQMTMQSAAKLLSMSLLDYL